MNTKLILTLLATVFASIAAPAKSHAGWPFSSSSSCGATYQPRCYPQSRYYQPSCQTYRPVQYYGGNCSSGQYYPQQYRPTYYPPQQCYQRSYQSPTVVYVYHPPVVTTTTQVVRFTRPIVAQPSCQSGRCSIRR